MGGRFALTEDEGWELLRRAPQVRVAAVVDGQPLLRTMHAALVGRRLVLHGTPRSTKAAWEGTPVVAAAEEVVARVPSWMRHPEKACPATTYYRSVQLDGHMVKLDDPELRAEALQALMHQLQPEGGYRPLSATDPLYAASIRGLGMWAIEPDRISAVAKLGQNLKAPEMTGILTGLWTRGGPGDLLAIEALAAVHPERPSFWSAPEGLRPRCHPSSRDVDQAVALVRGTYWNHPFDDATLAGAVRGSAWVGLEREGELVATARAISDRAKRAWIYDVAVHPSQRGQGVGTAIMRLLMDHPLLRDTYQLRLTTRDATAFYEKLGFVALHTHGGHDTVRTELARTRHGWPA
ncbi:MAG: GNAT family N-acetyltransferase [Myxococcales bacterium]|nr:GNAT family N-acetyltransferase [Myxococcales bacterium]